jgi:hypothetical protein
MKTVLTFLLLLALTVSAKGTVNVEKFEVQLKQTVGSMFDLDVEIRRTGATSFVLGTSTFVFNYDTAALGTPAKVAANDGPWDDTDGDYLNVTLIRDTLTGFACLTVEFAGGNDDNGAAVPMTYTRVGTVRFTIKNALLTPGLTWRNIGANTQVNSLANPGVSGGGQTDMTASGTFLPPLNVLTGVTEKPVSTEFALDQNYPNPFNPTTILRYALPRDAFVTLTVHNILGQEIVRLRDEVQSVGFHEAVWDGKNNVGGQVSSGVYIYRIAAKPLDGSNLFTSFKKMLMLK